MTMERLIIAAAILNLLLLFGELSFNIIGVMFS
jgi:hypothetical protein